MCVYIYTCICTHTRTGDQYNPHLGLINGPPLIYIFPNNNICHY